MNLTPNPGDLLLTKSGRSYLAVTKEIVTEWLGPYKSMVGDCTVFGIRPDAVAGTLWNGWGDVNYYSPGDEITEVFTPAKLVVEFEDGVPWYHDLEIGDTIVVEGNAMMYLPKCQAIRYAGLGRVVEDKPDVGERSLDLYRQSANKCIIALDFSVGIGKPALRHITEQVYLEATIHKWRSLK